MKLLYALLLIAGLFASGCTFLHTRADLARFAPYAAPTAEEEASSREIAMKFIRYAQAGDVEQMLRITSPLSHTKAADAIRALYTEQVIPQFKDTVVTWKPHGKRSHDENNNPGITFSGDA